MRFLLQVLQWERFLSRQFHLASLQCLQSDNPWGYCAHSVFGSERTQRHILPSLEISKTPIIQDNESKNVLPGLLHFDWLSQIVRMASNECSNLDLEVQSFAFWEGRQSCIFTFDLSAWTSKRSPTHNNWWCSPMISDRDMQLNNDELYPILLQSICRSSDDWSDIESVRSRWIKISIVSNLCGQVINCFWCSKEYLFP